MKNPPSVRGSLAWIGFWDSFRYDFCCAPTLLYSLNFSEFFFYSWLSPALKTSCHSLGSPHPPCQKLKDNFQKKRTDKKRKKERKETWEAKHMFVGIKCTYLPPLDRWLYSEFLVVYHILYHHNKRKRKKKPMTAQRCFTKRWLMPHLKADTREATVEGSNMSLIFNVYTLVGPGNWTIYKKHQKRHNTYLLSQQVSWSPVS